MLAYGTEKPQSYRPRVLDERPQKLLDIFGAVEMRGRSGAANPGPHWRSERASFIWIIRVAKTLTAANPSLALQGKRPHVIDERQVFPPHEMPRVEQSTRLAAREASTSSPVRPPRRRTPSHSGAGRITRLDMSAMTLWERGLSTGAVALSGLFEGSFKPLVCDTS